MNGKMMKKDGHLFKSCSRILVPLIHLGGKMTCYGTMIAYILVRVPSSSKRYFSEFHSSPIGGNSGFLKTYYRVKKDIFWDGLKTDVKKIVAKCLVCQQNKVEIIKTPSLLQPLSIPSQRWTEVSMDFNTGLPKFKGKSVIMVVVVDRLTKYAHFCALSHPFKESTIANYFMETVQEHMVIQIL